MLGISLITVNIALVISFLCCVNSLAHADSSVIPVLNADTKIKALTALNKIRRQAHLKPFSPNKYLIHSSKNHALYSTENNLDAGHIEYYSTRPGFTGETPVERTSYAGYVSLFVAENVSSGQNNYETSIEGLMAAIYHRLAFLNPLYDEVGMARTHYQDGRTFYVYNLGNQSYNYICQEPAYMGFESYYLKVCKPDIKIKATRYNKIKKAFLSNAPELILWPTDNALNIPPVFYEEDPDPLPDYSVAGYPISIEANLHKLKNFRLHSFNLYRQDTGEMIKETRLLNSKNDPNQKLTPGQFALFPLKRLDNDTNYRVFVHYYANEKLMSKSWSFKTRPLAKNKRIITIKPQQAQLTISSLLDNFILYFPPTDAYPSFDGFQVKYSLSMKPEIQFIDKNTLSVKLNSAEQGKLKLILNDLRELTIIRNGMADKIPQQPKKNRINKHMAIYDSKSKLLSLPFVRESGELQQLYLQPIKHNDKAMSFRVLKSDSISSTDNENIFERDLDTVGKGLLDSLSIDGKIYPYVLLRKDIYGSEDIYTFIKQ